MKVEKNSKVETICRISKFDEDRLKGLFENVNLDFTYFKLTEIDLCLTAITNYSISYIVAHLKCLEKLSLTGRLSFDKFFELKSMPKLQVLNCPYLTGDEIVCLKDQLPHLE